MSVDLPIPGFVEVGEVDGGFFAISERVFGEFLKELSPESMQATAPAVLRLFDALREADTSAPIGFGPWTPEGNGHYTSWRNLLEKVENEVPGRSRAEWGEAREESAFAALAFEAGVKAVEGLAPHLPNQRSVEHSDLLNRNDFVAGDRIMGVFDCSA